MEKATKDAITAKKSPRAAKGAPSGIVISLIVHAVAIMVAAVITVFIILPPPAIKITPPPAYVRPVMKLIEPRVKIDKSSPPKPLARIIAKAPKVSMPEIQIPVVSGGEDGLLDDLGDGVGTLLDLPDLGDITNEIGYKETIEYLQGLYNLDEAIDKAKRRTRNYAKRQITWFSKIPGLKWYNPDVSMSVGLKSLPDVLDSCRAY